MILMIDNYDSFTFNLVQYFRELSQEVVVYRNDSVSVSELIKLKPSHLIISPGPCTPNDAGISIEAIQYFSGKIPILGVCLGHQVICQVFGAKIIRTKKVVHGYTSKITHTDKGVFSGIPSSFNAMRYHSLIVDSNTLNDDLEITATTQEDGLIMGIKHRKLAIEGIQFHPESVLTEHGHQLLNNFLKQY